MRILLIRRAVPGIVALTLLAAPAHAAFGIPGPSQLILDLVGKFTGGLVKTEGVTGWPNALHIDRLELTDAEGAWLIAEDITLDWHPYKLASKQADIDVLRVGRLQIPRLQAATPPAPDAAPAPASSGLPVQILIHSLHADRIELGASVIAAAAALSLDGSLLLPSLQTPTAHLVAQRLDGGGTYKIDADVTEQRVDATLAVTEPEHGLIATLAKLPDIGALAIDAKVQGPQSALATDAKLSAGPLAATAQGTVNLTGSSLDLQVQANAPAMKPAPEVSWQAVQVQAHVQGPFTTPDATGHLQVDALEAAGASVRRLAADLSGNAGQVSLKATAEGVRAPLPDPEFLAGAPITLEATARLDDPARPVTFKLAHPLLSADGTARTAGAQSADVDLRVPRLAPFAALGGVDLQGSTAVHLHAAMQDGASTLTGDGTLSIASGLAPLPGLIGDDAHVSLAMQAKGANLTISRMTVAGRTVQLSLSGGRTGTKLTGDIQATLSDLHVLAPTLSGAIDAKANVSGTQDDLAVTAHAAGTVGAQGVPSGPVTLDVAMTGLPTAPTGTIKAQGRLADAPLSLAVDASRAADGAVQVKIDRADWRSLHADGALSLPPGATLPLGRVQLRMGQLGDLRPFVGQPLTGSLNATLDIDPKQARLLADLRNAGIPGSRIGQASLSARVDDPLHAPRVDASANLAGIDAAGVTGSAKVNITGRQDALAIRTDAALVLSGTPAQINAAASLNVPAKSVRLQTFQVAAKGQTARLLAPATVSFGGPVAVDRLRIGLQQAVLDVAGQLSPRLDATVTLRTPAAIAAIAAPDLALDGQIALDAKLTGTPALPGGTVRLAATGIRMRSGPGRAVPPANLNATVDLNGRSARVDARLVAGSARLAVAGQAPLGAGPLNLRANGGLDLTLLDPILTAAGRRARGRLTLDATVTGTAAAPRVGGTAQLAQGEIQDFTQGLRIRDIAATVRGDGETIRLVSLTGRAGPGTISASGTVGIGAPGLPIDLALKANNARPITSDNLQLNLDADLALRGQAQGEMSATGRILIRNAEIRIPSHLPVTVAALNVIRPGQQVAKAPTGPAPSVRLDLVIDAPSQIFVRGRGVDAEMSGELRVRGEASKPQVSGGFDMRRGQLSLAGTTLDFTRGRVGFDGTGPGGKIDPTLDFVAESTSSSVTATLSIGGYASNPVIKLTSVPSLPQDEVLSYLLFRRSLKEIGPFQIASIAASLAELTGIGGDGANPLGRLRSGLGLDRLNVGGSTTGSGASVEAGKYVASGVYLGAKQGTSSDTGTGATLQIDITKGLKLETDVGTGRGGNSVGLTYQFEY